MSPASTTIWWKSQLSSHLAMNVLKSSVTVLRSSWRKRIHPTLNADLASRPTIEPSNRVNKLAVWESRENRLQDGIYTLGRASELIYEICQGLRTRVEGGCSTLPDLLLPRSYIYDEYSLAISPFFLQNMKDVRLISNLPSNVAEQAAHVTMEKRKEINTILMDNVQSIALFSAQISMLHGTFEHYSSMENYRVSIDAIQKKCQG